jgi:endonuclease YncB( thermonuclease family)
LASASAQTLVGRVVAIADGDTLTVLDDQKTQHKIRLAGIDAPERKQPFGQVSKQYLSSLVSGQSVEVKIEKQDRYRRSIGKVLVNGRDANLALVTAGLAWHYKKYQNEQNLSDRLLYSSAETQARQERRGLWSNQKPVAPWAWRGGER